MVTDKTTSVSFAYRTEAGGGEKGGGRKRLRPETNRGHKQTDYQEDGEREVGRKGSGAQ